MRVTLARRRDQKLRKSVVHTFMYVGVSMLLPSIRFTRGAYHAEVFVLASRWTFVCVMCSVQSVLCAVSSQCDVQFLVCVMSSFCLYYVQFFCLCYACFLVSVMCVSSMPSTHASARGLALLAAAALWLLQALQAHQGHPLHPKTELKGGGTR